LLASAGTGKTYQLSGHFLRLLFAGVPPERVLATTFTRKAAGEILDRVLSRLLDATRDCEKLAGLEDAVGRPLERGECVALLARVSRRLDRFRVRTLDSFFVHVGRLFALDLGLTPDWALVDELSTSSRTPSFEPKRSDACSPAARRPSASSSSAACSARRPLDRCTRRCSRS
jgi:ATP-dependent exoDNAse (exonuclease V) beta subunit